jgi:two-component system chemotaxis response regulator CheY
MTANYRDLRVLVVEDDANMQTLIKSVLEHLEFQSEKIYQSTNGAEAIEFLKSREVDFIICDWEMENMDGLTFVRILRDPKETPARGVPIILCSGKLDREVLDKVLYSGVNEAIVKPISIGAVESRIKAILERPRPIFENENYVGPDRRRREAEFGPRERRAEPRETAREPESKLE